MAKIPSGEMVGHLRISMSHWGGLIRHECAKESGIIGEETGDFGAAEC